MSKWAQHAISTSAVLFMLMLIHGVYSQQH